MSPWLGNTPGWEDPTDQGIGRIFQWQMPGRQQFKRLLAEVAHMMISEKGDVFPRVRVSTFTSKLSAVAITILLCFLAGCGSKPKVSQPGASTPSQEPAPASLETTDAGVAKQTTVLSLPKNFGRSTGDWDQIVKRGSLRVLVVNNRYSFFYDQGRPRGVVAEFMEEFEKVINKKLKPGVKKFTVLYLPVSPGVLLEALNEGMGDIACTGIIITPDREKLVDFTVPIKNDVRLVAVTSKVGPSIARIDDLSRKDVYVNPASIARTELETLNQRFKQAGKPEMAIKAVDPNLTEDDLLEMVNAGLIPTTVSFDFRAELWSKVFSQMVVTQAVLTEDQPIGWAMRKGSPELKEVMDDFIKNHGRGTVFGNLMLQRYMKNTHWI